jgi:uncharacterized cupredoxin-like copper-binding protein
MPARRMITLALCLVACRESAPPNVVTIVAKDYSFDAPAQIPAGVTSFRLVNQGHEAHHILLIRLADGKTAADLGAAMKQAGPLPSWATTAGGPNAPNPGDTSRATLTLEPGSYVMICVIPSADHVPHMAKGMVAPLTVTTGPSAAGAEPRSDLTLTLTDYAFTLSTPITAGVHTFRVDNAGTQPHEALVARLAPGKSAADLVRWLDNEQGPPPADALGGVTPMAVGEHAYFTENFTPGHYAFFCFWPDAKDGAPHVAHGMVKEFTIIGA